MDTNDSVGKPRRPLRFSLAMLLVLVTCVCCFLAGNLRGHRQAYKTIMRKLPTSSKTYYVEDLLVDKGAARGTVQVDYDGLMNKIMQQCSPDQWEKTGGPGRISPFPLNLSLVISGNDIVHQEIDECLKQLRAEKFGPDYEMQNVAPVGFVQAAATPVAKTVSKTYFVSDLVGDNAPDEIKETGVTDAHGVVNLVKKTISPGIWGPGGTSTINASPSDARVQVDASPIVHEMVLDLLAQLRRSKLRREEASAGASVDAADEFLDLK